MNYMKNILVYQTNNLRAITTIYITYMYHFEVYL